MSIGGSNFGTFIRKPTVLAVVGALLIGIGATLAVELITGQPHFDSSQVAGAANPTCVTPAPANRPEEGPAPPIVVCVETPPSSPFSDFLRSVVAALAGGLLGVGTFVAGQILSSARERRSGQAAVTAIIQELQTARATMNYALNPPPPSPVTEEVRLSVSIFPQLRVQLAERLPYDLLARTYNLYDRLAQVTPKELRTVNPIELTSLRDSTAAVERDLAPYSRPVR